MITEIPAQPLQPYPLDNSPSTARLDTTTDEDWFRFTVTRRSLVLIYTVNPDPAFQTTDTYGKLYDAGGSYLGYSNDVSGAAENFQISAQLSAGTYYLRVSDDDRERRRKL